MTVTRTEKPCYICREVKSLDEFHRNKGRPDGHQDKCKLCHTAQAKEYYRANAERVKTVVKARGDLIKQAVWDAKNVPCTDCGVSYPSWVMDFDHVGDDKLYDVSKMMKRKMSMAKILTEIAKCEVVCANCHRARTHARGWTGSRLFTDETRVVDERQRTNVGDF